MFMISFVLSLEPGLILTSKIMPFLLPKKQDVVPKSPGCPGKLTLVPSSCWWLITGDVGAGEKGLIHFLMRDTFLFGIKTTLCL